MKTGFGLPVMTGMSFESTNQQGGNYHATHNQY